MDVELSQRMEVCPHATHQYRTDLNLACLRTVCRAIQKDHPDTLTDDVMSLIHSTAYMSTLPMFHEEVDAQVRTMTDPVVRRAYLQVSSAIQIFVSGWFSSHAMATDETWERWIDDLGEENRAHTQ